MSSNSMSLVQKLKEISLSNNGRSAFSKPTPSYRSIPFRGYKIIRDTRHGESIPEEVHKFARSLHLFVQGDNVVTYVQQERQIFNFRVTAVEKRSPDHTTTTRYTMERNTWLPNTRISNRINDSRECIFRNDDEHLMNAITMSITEWFRDFYAHALVSPRRFQNAYQINIDTDQHHTLIGYVFETVSESRTPQYDCFIRRSNEDRLYTSRIMVNHTVVEEEKDTGTSFTLLHVPVSTIH